MHSEYLTYYDGRTILEGYFARPVATDRNYPLVLIAHTWAGMDEFVCKADQRSWLAMQNFFQEIFA